FWGLTSDKPVTGDWIGQGRDTVGLYRDNIGTWFLSNSTLPPNVDIQFGFASPGDIPLVWQERSEGLPGGPGNVRSRLGSGSPDTIRQADSLDLLNPSAAFAASRFQAENTGNILTTPCATVSVPSDVVSRPSMVPHGTVSPSARPPRFGSAVLAIDA